MPNLGQPNLNKISTTPKTIRIVNTENNSNTAITSTNKIGQLGQGKNLKSNANAHESKQIKFNVEELDTIEFTSSIYDTDTGIKEKIQKKVKISEIESGDLYKITYKPNKVKLNEQQKLMLVDAIIKHNKSLFFDIDRMVLNLGFTNQKNLVSSLQKIIINLKKTLGTDDDGESFNYSKVNNICKNFHKFKITDERLKAQLCETIAQNFPISAIKHKDTLGISSKKALDRLQATRINKDDLEETVYNLHSCISRYSRQREGEKSLKSIMQILNQSSPIDQLAIAKKMLKTQPSSLIICLNYLKLSDSIKADLIKQIANTNFDDYHKKGRGYDIAHGKNIHPHLMLALYENSFKDKYKLNFSFEQFDKKANVLEMRLITTFITDNDYLFKNDELINKYGKLLDKFSLEEKHKLADLIVDYQQEGALSELIKHFKFDEANRIKVLDKIIAKYLKGETYVHLISVMYELDNFEISDAEKRMKYFLHLSHRDVGYYFHSNFGIDEFVKPLKNLIKKSDDINQQYAIEHFTVLLLKTFIDRDKIKLDDNTKLLQQFTQFIQTNQNLIQPIYQSINDIIGALFLRTSLMTDFINILKSNRKSTELLELLPKPEGKSNNQEKIANRQRLTIMELYSLVPDFKTNKDQNIQRLYDLLASATIYKSPTSLNITLELMHTLVSVNLPKDVKISLLKLCLPNNRIKNNKEYNQELCLNLSKIQLILFYAHQNKYDDDKIDPHKKEVEDNLANINSKSDLNKLYKKCISKLLPDVNAQKLNEITNSSKEYSGVMQFFNYISSMQHRLAQYSRYDETSSESELFNQSMNKFINILINETNQANQDYYALKYNPKTSRLVEHLEKKHPQALQNWKNSSQKINSSDGKVSFISSDNFKDLIEMTKGRCLDVRFSGSGNNIATPSMLLNPQYRVSAILDNKTGEILEFYRERLVLDNKTKEPIIYKGRLQTNKKPSEEQKKEFNSAEQKRWQKMEINVVIEGGTEKNKQTPEVTGLKTYANELVIPPSEIAPLDYIDDSVNERYKTHEEYVFPEKSTHVLFDKKFS